MLLEEDAERVHGGARGFLVVGRDDEEAWDRVGAFLCEGGFGGQRGSGEDCVGVGAAEAEVVDADVALGGWPGALGGWDLEGLVLVGGSMCGRKKENDGVLPSCSIGPGVLLHWAFRS